MLASLRKSASSWVVRIFLFLLVLSFGVWGIGDLIRGTQDTSVVRIGDVKVSMPEFNQQYRTALQQLQRRFGPSITGEQARQLGLPEQVLDQIAGRSLLDQESKALGLSVSDQTVVAVIRDDPAFRSPTGAFDRFTMEQRLRAEGLNEKAFVSITRQNLQREQIVNALGVGAAVAPAILVKTLYGYRAEKRVAVMLTIPPAKTGPAPEPTQQDLEKFHKDHAAEFTAPEYRALTFVTLTPEDRAADVKVSDKDLQDAYDSARQNFTQPEKRHLQQIVFSDEASAKAAYEKLKAGADFAAVAKETRNLTPKDIDLGMVTRAGLGNASATIADAAFSLAKGAVSAPLKSPFGWNLIKVTEIQPATVQPFDAVKDKLRQEIALRRAGDEMFDLSNQLQDALAGGATIEEAAAKLKLTAHKIAAVDAKGLGPDGKPAAGLPPLPQFLTTAFEAAAGADPEVVDTGDSRYFAIKVNGVTPATLRPLDTVRAAVAAGWKAEKQREAARKLATEMAGKLKAGADFAALAKSIDESLTTTPAMTRDGAGADASVSAPLLSELFAAKPGAVITAPAPKGGGTIVARLEKIVPADPKADKAGYDQLEKTLATGIQNDIFGQYRKALESQYGVTVNRKNLEGAL